ncbi:hypothetical protein QR46_0001 [Giardia duodenalis assemblage B]|uniref:Uncharacterized protein n=1 Tax=Giardia duodenalis assemblage B TaxID=1394984 RepID=A0A132P0S4_GIAIN|nr:hypothetical protein QR46_0001 [Giardia intestinalis assemblage B]
MKCRRFYTLRYRNCVAGLIGILAGTLAFSTYRIPFDDLERFTRCSRGSYIVENPSACPYPNNGSAAIFFYAQVIWIAVFGLLGFLLSLFTPTFKHVCAIVWCEHFTKFSINTAIGCLVHLLFIFPFISVTPENYEAYNALRTFVTYAYFIWYVYILAYSLLLFMSIFVLDYLEADQIAADNRAIAREDAITSYQRLFTESIPPAAPPNEGMIESVHQIHIRVVGELDHRQAPPEYTTKNFLNKNYKMRYLGLVLTTSFFVYGICVGAGYIKAAPECSQHRSGSTIFQCVPVASWIYGAVYGLVWAGVFYATVFSRAIPKVGLFGKRALAID